MINWYLYHCSILYLFSQILKRYSWHLLIGQKVLNKLKCLFWFESRYLMSCSSNRYIHQSIVCYCPSTNLQLHCQTSYYHWFCVTWPFYFKNKRRVMLNYLTFTVPWSPFLKCFQAKFSQWESCWGYGNPSVGISTKNPNTNTPSSKFF